MTRPRRAARGLRLPWWWREAMAMLVGAVLGVVVFLTVVRLLIPVAP